MSHTSKPEDQAALYQNQGSMNKLNGGPSIQTAMGPLPENDSIYGYSPNSKASQKDISTFIIDPKPLIKAIPKDMPP